MASITEAKNARVDAACSRTVTHATGREVRAAHCASRVVFPKPAGAETRISARARPASSWRSKRARARQSEGMRGACGFARVTMVLSRAARARVELLSIQAPQLKACLTTSSSLAQITSVGEYCRRQMGSDCSTSSIEEMDGNCLWKVETM